MVVNRCTEQSASYDENALNAPRSLVLSDKPTTNKLLKEKLLINTKDNRITKISSCIMTANLIVHSQLDKISAHAPTNKCVK